MTISSNAQELLDRAMRQRAAALKEARERMLPAEAMPGVQQILRSESGKALMAYLENLFPRTWFDTDAERCRRHGHLDVIEELARLRDFTGETTNG